MNQNSDITPLKLTNQILDLCKYLAKSYQIKAIYIIDNFSINKKKPTNPIEVVLILKDFQPRISTNIKSIEQRNITIFAVDQWIYERDVERGFLGESFASGLVFPYIPLVGQDYLSLQEISLKKRLIIEMLENIVQSYPELSYHIKIKPEYFMYEAMLDRVRIFPPLYYSLSDFLTRNSPKEKVDSVLRGYISALLELKNEKRIFFSNNCVSLKKRFVDKSKNPTVYIKNLKKVAPRGIFTTFFAVYSQLLKFFSQKTNILFNLRNSDESDQLELNKNFVNPREYVFIQTNENVFSLADGVDMATFAKKHLIGDKKTDLTFDSIGGVLNDVYLIRAQSEDKEKKIIVKQFKEWSGFKWFPLSLWSLGARNLSVLARTRLANEYSINEHLRKNGFQVPQILHVSHKKRLLFMEFIEGKDLSIHIKNFIKSPLTEKSERDLTIIKEVGKIFAQIHSIDITLGDTKPENTLIDSNGKIYLLDFEQASFGGDKAWDLAVFLYFIGHYIPPFSNKDIILSMVNAFLEGYLKGGGDLNDIKKVGNSKYSRLFSIFMLPNVLILISNACKNKEVKLSH